jgi:hypothetical protein
VGPVRAALVTEGDLEFELLASDLTNNTNAVYWPNDGTAGQHFTSTMPTGVPVQSVATSNGTYQAVVFDGTDQSFVGGYPSPDLLGSSSRSIEVWVDNPNTAGQAEATMVAWGAQSSFGNTNEAFSDGGEYTVGHEGAYDLAWADQGVNGYTSAPASNTWHYFVYTYDGSTSDVYVDGQLAATAVVGALATALNPIAIAAQNSSDGPPWGNAVYGQVDIASVRIESGVLTPSDITNNYAEGVPGQPVPEPASVGLLVLGGAGLLRRQR